MNLIIVLFKNLNVMAITTKQFDFIAHHSIFAAAQLIPVMCYENSHAITVVSGLDNKITRPKIFIESDNRLSYL